MQLKTFPTNNKSPGLFSFCPSVIWTSSESFFHVLAVIGLTKEKTTQPAIGKQEHGTDMVESAPQGQTNNDIFTYVNGACTQKNRSNKKSALGLVEDIESLWVLTTTLQFFHRSMLIIYLKLPIKEKKYTNWTRRRSVLCTFLHEWIKNL